MPAESSTPRAVILGADTNGLAHVRALGKMGICSYVVCSGTDHMNLARFSKYCEALFVSSDAENYEKNLKKTLIDLGRRLRSSLVIFPTSDFFVNFLSSNNSQLKKYFLFNVPSSDVLRLIVNKFETDRMAQSLGIRSPKTVEMGLSETAGSISKSLSFPCIVKPKDSFSIAFPWKNKIIATQNELENFLKKYHSLKEHVVIQEIIPGEEQNIYQCTAYIGYQSEAQFFTMQKIHQRPPGYGVATLGRSVTVPKLIAATKNLLSGIGYTGFASVEFKQSDNDDNYYLIEVNPRLPWYNALFLASGVNFPYRCFIDLSKGKEHDGLPVDMQKDDVYWMHFSHEISSLAQKKAQRIPINILKTIQYIAKARSFAYFDPFDLKPFLMVNLELVNSMREKFFGSS